MRRWLAWWRAEHGPGAWFYLNIGLAIAAVAAFLSFGSDFYERFVDYAVTSYAAIAWGVVLVLAVVWAGKWHRVAQEVAAVWAGCWPLFYF
jgi:hypothetical protein